MQRNVIVLLGTITLGLLLALGALTFQTRIVSAQTEEKYTATGYSTLGATSYISGTLDDICNNDLTYMSFRSYFSGKDLSEPADSDSSNVDFSANKGTHSNFTAQQNGPDSVYDLLIEANTSGGVPANYELDLEVQWNSVDSDEENEELAIYLDAQTNTHCLDAIGGYVIIGDGTPNWGSPIGTISFWIRWTTIGGRPWGQHADMETRFLGSNLVLDWGGSSSLISSTSFVAGKWYFIAIVWNENTNELHLYVGDQDNLPVRDAFNIGWTSTVSTLGVIENNFMASRGGLDPTNGFADDLRYWNIDRTNTEIQSDYNIEMNGSELNLRSYFKLNNNVEDTGPENRDGSIIGNYLFYAEAPFDATPTENLQVDVWNNNSWQVLLTDLEAGWNNISISPLLNSPSFTIRFKGGTESNDTTQDYWKVDVVLLHTWSEEHAAKVEFTGLSNQESWSRLTWTIISSWTASSVNVTLQLYNYTLDDYPSSGNGCLRYVSATTSSQERRVNQTITVDPGHFRNGTGHWKMKIIGVKPIDSQFEVRVNLVEYKSTTSSAPTSWSFEWTIGIICVLTIGILIPFTMKLRNRRSNKANASTLTFREQFGKTYRQIVGKDVLLEINPMLGYHSSLFDFASDVMNNKGQLIVFTSKNSALHTAFSDKPVEFFLLTPKISSSKRINKRQILVPVSDLSVMLDTLAKIPKKRKDKPVTLLFDNLSDMILLCGFEKTYKFLRFLLDTISSPDMTNIFIFNPTAHSPEISSSIRGLFQLQLTDVRTRLTRA